MKNHFCHTKYSARAFSLIELLVVVAIIGIVTTIMMLSITSGRVQKDVEGAASFASAKVREAQTAALTGKQETPNTTPCAYRIVWGGTQVTSSYVYKDGSGNCTGVTTITASTLPSGVTFTDTGSVDFVLPHAKVASSQVLTLQKGSVSRVVCLRSNGLIEPDVSSSSC